MISAMQRSIKYLLIFTSLFVSALQSPNRYQLSARKTGGTSSKKVASTIASLIDEVNSEEENQNSLAKIDELSDDGRLILLICKNKCLKQRAEIPKWIEEFNTDYKTSVNDNILNYHFHLYRYPIERYNADKILSSRNYLLFYIVGPESVSFDKEFVAKTSFWKWLTSLEKISDYPRFRLISEGFDFDDLLNEVSHRCKNDLLYNSYDVIGKEDESLHRSENNNTSNKGADQFEYILEPSTSWERRRLAQNKKTSISDSVLIAEKPVEYRQRLYISDNEVTGSAKIIKDSKQHRKRSTSSRSNGKIADLYRRKNHAKYDKDRTSQPLVQPRDQLENGSSKNPDRDELTHRKGLLVVHHPDLCPALRLPNFVRMFHKNANVTLAELRRPLNAEVDVILRQRLIGIQYQCQMIVLMNNNKFVQLPVESTITEVYNSVKIWRDESNDACERGLSPLDHSNRIRHSLTDAEIIYYKEEVLIQRIEFSHAFIIVGVVGGLAVIALAISIFWGLNGTSFVSK